MYLKNLMEHDEAREGEIFIGNVEQEAFNRMEYKTKRRGNIPRYMNQRMYEDYEISGIRPVFITQEEADFLNKKGD